MKQTWENRIVGEGVEDPEQLLANPKNYRIHPRGQQLQMEAIFDKVGIVQRVIVNRRTGHLVDGHMRVQLAMGRLSEIPVVYVDLSPEEEDLVLATLDPIGDLAAADREQLAALLDDVGSVDGLDELLAGLAEDALPTNPTNLVDLPAEPASDDVVHLEFFLTKPQAAEVERALASTGRPTPAAALLALCELAATMEAH